MGSEGGAVVRALASHQFDFGSNPGVDAICGLSLLLVLSFAPRGFSPGTAVDPSPPKPTFANSNSTRNQVEFSQVEFSQVVFPIYHCFYHLLLSLLMYRHTHSIKITLRGRPFDF